jgi:predicted short-subunit dehydrogenase-like oxidoreductase (DUF2520 family)
MNKIVLIGWGNVAQHFAKSFQSLGFEIVQVITRNSKSPFPNVHSISEINTSADCYFIAVPDDGLAEVAEQLPQLQGLVIHCCGSKGKEILKKQKRNGVLYPVQTFRKESEVDLMGVPFFLESYQISDLLEMKKWVNHWGGNAIQLSSEEKQKIHLAAVWSMNFSNAMHVVSEKILKEMNIPFEILKPLLIQALNNALELGPKSSQTGPAVRRDEHILKIQSEQMQDELEKTVYLAISKLIQKNT